MNFKTEYSNKITKIDNYISKHLENEYKEVSPVLLDSMKYSVLNGGKRLRSILCTQVCSMFGGSEEVAMPFAAAIEMIHAYSLVHDDLPSMDNSDTRRGMPSCHKKYGEAYGILCGDALLNGAYELMASSCEDKKTIDAMKIISKSSGARGMIDGQVIDIKLSEEKSCDISALIKLIELKTMALIKASIMSGAVLASCTEDEFKSMEEFSYHLGLAFQIRDDFEDIDEDASEFNDSPNFINFLGKEKARELLNEHYLAAKEIINKYKHSDFLNDMLTFLFD